VSEVARFEDVVPLVARAVVDEHVHAVTFLDFESRRERFESGRRRAALATNEEAIAGSQDEGFAALVVPVGRVTVFAAVGVTRVPSRHAPMLPLPALFE
jgi:hypothetical protein